MCMKNHVLFKKCLQIELNMDLPQWGYNEKTIDGVETHKPSVKEKILGAEGHADSLLEHERTLLQFIFLKKMHL